jgi:hypothetical protein
MSGRFEYEPTGDLRATQNSIRAAVNRYGRTDLAAKALAEVAAQSQELFFPAALAMLDSPADSCPDLRTTLLKCPEFLTQLVNPNRFEYHQLRDICCEFGRVDALLDIRLARLAPGRGEDLHHLDSDSLVRLITILNEISAGPRLFLVMSHLATHPDPRVASKAAILLGRRIQNRAWAERYIKSEEPRLRANVLEALWGRHTAWARQMMWDALRDPNNRMVGNGVYGIHLLGDSRAADLALHLLADSRPEFRATAAWVMSKMGNPEFEEPLRNAVADPESFVRRSAIRALVAIRKPILAAAARDLAALSEAVSETALSETALPEGAAQPEAEAREPEAVPSVDASESIEETPAAEEPPAEEAEIVTEAVKRPKPSKERMRPYSLRLDGHYTSDR